MRIDMSGADLSQANPDELRRIDWRFQSAHLTDQLEVLLGPYWYSKLDVTRLKKTIKGKKFTRTDGAIEEWGIVYNVFIEHKSDFPVLLVWYNISGGGHGARAIEWHEGRFEQDIDLRQFLLF